VIHSRSTGPIRILAASLVVFGTLAVTGCAAGPAWNPLAESAPSVEAITPASGALVAGATVTITGTALTDVTGVTLGGVGATAVTVVDDSTVTAVVPVAPEFEPGAQAVEVLAHTEPVQAAATLTYTREVVTPVDAQLKYAFDHWAPEDYNLAGYGEFNSVGGDCMNFVSQTLIERGIPQTDGWNFTSTKDYTGSWIHVPSFENYLLATPGAGFTRLTIDQRDQVEVGDIVAFDWNRNDSPDHIQIVSAVEVVDGQTKILMVGHNLDSNWRDLDQAITVDHPGAEAWFWKVP
jgi:hypothetical protein